MTYKPMNTQPPPIRNRQRGFGLIESLVALVVVSVGMIGIAALYGQGLSASRTALYRTQAVNLASDMADRIRLNRQGAASYGGGAANNNCEPGGVSCTPAQMAAHDLWAWNNLIDQQLAGADGTVTYMAALPPTYTIQVTWQEVGFGAITHQIAISVPDL
jgi:type IV pilus assembly protein PilV